MPWKESSTMSLRVEFVELALQEGANISELCRLYGISRKTGYKWLGRFREGGLEALGDRSRQPHSSPGRTPVPVEANVLEVRKAHPTWGGRKIQAYLQAQGEVVPRSPNTITAILRRHDRIAPEESRKHRPFRRFELAEPNQLWQMDFKGYFALSEVGYCHPLTVLDDHSRFLVGLRACPNQTYDTVRSHLTDIFRRYGLPERMLMDNGSPWGDDADTPHTILTAWLIRLGIKISHSRPYHPQTLGKDERLHRTLSEDLIRRRPLENLVSCQEAFDAWREMYNCERPHEALEMKPPVSRYRPSLRPFPEPLPPILYDPDDVLRKVDSSGKISFRNRTFRVGKAFRRQPVAIRPSGTEGILAVFFCDQEVVQINLREDNASENV